MTRNPKHHESNAATDANTARSRGTGIGSILGGTALIALGIPMLVLPGPGIAAILGGGALVARGVRRKGR